MSHPFGDLLAQFLHRKHGLSQSKLAAGILQPPSIISEMCKGKRLTGPQARARVVAIIGWLQQQGALGTLEDANALLDAAGMSALQARDGAEAMLIAGLRDQPPPQPLTPRTRREEQAAPRHNLPAQTSSFIGHERELSELRRLLLSGGTRLLTLTGSGGVGKTRLAVRLCSEVVDTRQYVDGVWLVEFGSLEKPELVPQAVATVLGIHEETGHPIPVTLNDHLRDRDLLLLLDNCEHLIEAVARLADALLLNCPKVSILATSREGLAIAGEQAWRVHSLEAPRDHQQAGLADLAHYEAVRLFDERARSVSPTFTLTEENAPAVREICSRLDGIPLAIELAAARVNVLSVEDIRERLSDRFRLLTGGSRTASPRQQTLRATLDWSYQLLSEPERILFCQLAVFASGWTLGAAETVCTGAGIEPAGVLDLLARLVDKSLVVAVTPAGAITRYHFLETIRQYAGEQLRERSGSERDAVRERHLAYYLALAEETMDLGGWRVDAWVRRVQPEYDNLRAAFAWARKRADRDSGEAMLRLAGGLRPFWHNSGFITEGLAWLEEALARGSRAPVAARARAMLAQATLYILQRANARGSQVGETALALFRQTEDSLGTAWCLELLANAAAVSDESTRSYSQQALDLFRAADSSAGMCRVLRSMCNAALHAGDRALAARLLEEAIVIAQENGDVKVTFFCLYRFYNLCRERAVALSEDQVAQVRETGDQEHLLLALFRLGDLLMAEGNEGRARPILKECLALRRQVSRGTFSSLWSSAAAAMLGYVEQSQGRVEEAIGWCELASTLVQEDGIWIAAWFPRFLTASILIAQGQTDEANNRLHECLKVLNTNTNRTEAAYAFALMASVSRRRGDMPRAARLLGAATMLEDALAQGVPIQMLQRWRRDAASTVYKATIDAARAQMGDAAFAAAWAAGQQMMLEQAIQYAMAA